MKPFSLHIIVLRVCLALCGTGIVLFVITRPNLSNAAPLSMTFPSTYSAGTAPTQSPYRLFLPFVRQSPLPIKKGLAFTSSYCEDNGALGSVWLHGWGPQPVNCPGIENVPMIWGTFQMTLTIGGNSPWLLGFNEPDLASQANMTPDDAAVQWRQLEANNPNRKLVAPVPSQLHPTWIVDFRNAYIAKYGTPPRLNALAMHCFSETASPCIQLGQTFKQWAVQWQVPEIWITEFAILPCGGGSTMDQIIQEARTFISSIENEPMFTRMAWYPSRIQGTNPKEGPCIAPLIDGSGQPSIYGSMYIGYR